MESEQENVISDHEKLPHSLEYSILVVSARLWRFRSVSQPRVALLLRIHQPCILPDCLLSQ